MRVDVLYIEGCPNRDPAIAAVHGALSALGLEATVVPQMVDPANIAQTPGFAGSPTVLIDGTDAIPDTTPTGEQACRVYRSGTGMTGHPTTEQLITALVNRS